MRIRLIANPAAGRGRGARRLPAARRALVAGWPDLEVTLTAAAGDEARLVADALAAGADAIAVLGGDGTWSKCAAALDAAGAARVPLCLFAGGTGNDFVKTLGTPAADPAAMAALVADRAARRVIDLACVEDRPFLNVAGFGFDAEIALALEARGRDGGTLDYLRAALR